jgi:hypothetical protein
MMIGMRDNDPYGWNTLGPGFPRLALGLAWLVSSLAVGALGWLLFAASDRRGPAAWVLLGAAVLGLAVTATVASNRKRAVTLTTSLVLSAAFVLAGVAAVLIVVAEGANLVVADLLLIGGLPVVAGVITGVLAGRARAMSR